MPTTMQSIVMLTRLPLRFGPHRTLHPVDTLIRCWESSRAFRIRDPGEMNKRQGELPRDHFSTEQEVARIKRGGEGLNWPPVFPFWNSSGRN